MLIKNHKNYPQILSLIFVVALINSGVVNAATISISDDNPVNVSTLNDNDSVNFYGGTLEVNAVKILDTVSANLNEKGTIDFNSTNNLTVTNNIGAAGLDVKNITFSADGTLESKGNIYVNSLGITTNTNNQGNLILSGTAAQTVSSPVGSADLRLKSVSINKNSGTATFAGDVYGTDLNTSGTGTDVVINGNGKLNFINSNFNQNTIINSTNANSFGIATLANAKTLTLNNDASITNLGFGTSGNLIIGSDKTVTFSGNISGTGLIKGSANNSGNIVFNGTSAQNVAGTIQLGDVSNRLNKISISNNNNSGVSFANDVFTKNLDFSNSSGTSKVTIASGKTINISGNITQSGAGSSVITGSASGVGTVSLSGSSAQIINSLLGSAASDRLGNLIIDNSSGVIFKQNAFLTTLTPTNGAISIAAGKIIDVTNAVNLSNKTLNLAAGTNSSSYSQIKSGSVITVNNNTKINFDYSNNNEALDHKGSTQYIVAQASNISGTVEDIIVTDNSFLFKNTLAQNGNNIVTTVTSDTNNFNSTTLGKNNYDLLNNALSNTNLASGIISVNSQSQLENGLKTLTPVSNGAMVTSVVNMNNTTANLANLRIGEVNSNVSGFSSGNSGSGNTGIWGEVFGNNAKQRKINDNDGYKANISGLMFGGDHLFDTSVSNILLGGGLAYSTANVTSSLNSDDKTNISSYQAILYNNNSAGKGVGLYNNNILNFSYNKYQTKRNIIMGSNHEIAKGNFDGQSYSAKSSLGYNFKLANKFLLAPNFGVKYFFLKQDNYQETGAGNSGLIVNNKNFHNFSSDIGIDLTSKFNYGDSIYIPKIITSWEHSFTNNTQRSNVAFIGGGASMQNDSVNIQQNKFNFGIGTDILDKKQSHTFKLQYNLQISTKYVSNGGFLQYRYDF